MHRQKRCPQRVEVALCGHDACFSIRPSNVFSPSDQCSVDAPPSHYNAWHARRAWRSTRSARTVFTTRCTCQLLTSLITRLTPQSVYTFTNILEIRKVLNVSTTRRVYQTLTSLNTRAQRTSPKPWLQKGSPQPFCPRVVRQRLTWRWCLPHVAVAGFPWVALCANAPDVQSKRQIVTLNTNAIPIFVSFFI